MRFWLVVITLILVPFMSLAKDLLVVGIDNVSAAVSKEFVEQGRGSDIELEFFGGQTGFVFENADEAKILVSDLNVNEEQNKFTATAEIFVDGKLSAETKLFGRYFDMTEVWLPVKNIEKDAIITQDDLVKAKIRSNRLRDDNVVDIDELVGKQAVRQIKADRPIMAKDIQDEVLITKGQLVTAVYSYKGLQITSRMEALEDGAKGQEIKLLNTKSKKEIVGKVLDDKTVEIRAE